MPTPKSKPSRMKKPMNSAAMMQNHNSWSPIGQLLSALIGERQRRDFFLAGCRGWSRFRVVFLRSFDDVALEQPEPDDREHRVNQRERHQGSNDHAGGVARDALADGKSDQLIAGRVGNDDPRLAAHFSEHPPGAAGQER